MSKKRWNCGPILAILAVISLFTVQSLTRALQTKTKLQHDIDKTSTLRDALRVQVAAGDRFRLPRRRLRNHRCRRGLSKAEARHRCVPNHE